MPRSKYNFGKDVGNGLRSTVIVAPVLWISRQFSEAPIAIKDKDGELHFDHPLVQLMNSPNPWYGGGALKSALSLDFALRGNAYMNHGRNERTRKPLELNYIPSFQVEPKGTTTELVTHYEHETDSGPQRIELEDMTHFRFGIDPHNQKLGLNPLNSLLREVFTDDEAANMTAAILRNLGVPGLVISPKDDADTIGEPMREKLKGYFRRMFRGDNAGDVFVAEGAVELKTVDVDLAKMNIDKLRQIPEERVTAVLGVPAAVVGFGTGLEQTKVGATMKELRELAYENVIIPTQRVFCEELDRSLLPEFESSPEQWHVVFDNSNVRVLQEDENRHSERLMRQWSGGGITRTELRTDFGREVTPNDEVYRQGISDVMVPTVPETTTADPAATIPGAGDLQQTALNGTQIASLVNILLQVSAGMLSTATTTELIAISFPSVSSEAIARMLAGVIAIAPQDAKRLITPGFVLKALKSNIQLVAAFTIDERALLVEWADELRKGFEEEGREIAELWLTAVGPKAAELASADQVIIDEIMTGYPDKTPDYDGQYLRVLHRTAGTIETHVGLGVMMDAPLERSVLQVGGTRKGLIDFTEQTRSAMYRAVAEARAEGLGPPAIARRIRDQIPAGPWLTVETRAELIAQAETKYAQNVSSMEIYSAADNVTGIIIFDAQHGVTHDPYCTYLEQERLNGRVWTVEEARAIEPTQHPNCSRSFAPVVGEEE